MASAGPITSEVEEVFKNIGGAEPQMPLVYTVAVEVRGHKEQALIDSGADKNHIDPHLVREKDYPTEVLPQPRHERFVDGQLHKCTSVAALSKSDTATMHNTLNAFSSRRWQGSIGSYWACVG